MKKTLTTVLFFFVVIASSISYWLTGIQVEAAIVKGESFKEGCIKLRSKPLYCDCIGNYFADTNAPYTVVDRVTLGWFWSRQEAQEKYASNKKYCESIR